MNITIVTQYFPPETCAVRSYDLAKEWVKAGLAVDVVTAFPHHPHGIVHKAYRRRLYIKEVMDGIHVHRNYLFVRPGMLGRILGEVTFSVSSVLISAFRVRKPDFVIASSPSFLSGLSGLLISKLRGAKFIFEVKDLWPAVMKGLDVLKIPFLYYILERMELFFYRHSYKVIVVTKSFKEDIVSRGIPEEKVEVVTNGFDSTLFFPREKRKDILESLKLNGKFVVGYIGNHGLSQGLEQLLYAAAELKHQEDVVFLLIGEGTQKARLKALAERLGLNNVIFMGGKPRNEVVEYICSCDLLYVSLKDLDIYNAFIPSKIYEIMACGRPILGALSGEAKEFLQASGAADVVPPGDAKAVAREIIRLKCDAALRDKMAQNGPKYVCGNYSRRRLAQLYLTMLHNA